MANPKSTLPSNVKKRLDEAQTTGQRVVVLTCGITGSGKSTLSHNITTQYPTFTRLSIDKTVHQQHGTYEIDYPASRYSQFQESAEETLKNELKRILNDGKTDVVLDLSFYSKEYRDEYREIVEREGRGRYKVVLVVLRVKKGDDEEEVLWRRVLGRKGDGERMREERKVGEGRGMEGMSVDRETLKIYMNGFEWPDGEGEIVVDVE